MTDQEAFEVWFKSVAKYTQPQDTDAWMQEAWNAALAWLRSQAEPVAWMTDKDDPITNPRRVEFWRQMGLRVIPLYTTPQPAIPDGWQLVPKEMSGEQWSAMRDEFSKYATRFEMAKTMCDADAIADVAPAEIYRAALAAAPEPSK